MQLDDSIAYNRTLSRGTSAPPDFVPRHLAPMLREAPTDTSVVRLLGPRLEANPSKQNTNKAIQ
jgi:hypothetical protein